MMKPSAFLVNMGRGAIVNEEALAYAVDHGIIAGAGLDVFVVEPIPENHPYMNMQHPERMSLAPHVAWGSVEARTRLVGMIADNIRLGW
jgi:glycerate dehydrogenase